MKKSKQNKLFDAVISIITVLLFFGTLITFSLITAFSEKETFSENMNRKLADFPKLSGKNIYNGKFMTGIEDYISDHFAGHDAWIKAKTSIELLSGKTEINDIYILKDRLVEKIDEPKPEITEKSIEGIKKFAEANNITPYVMLIPTQAEIYRDMLPANTPNPDQQKYIGDVYSQLGSSAVCIDAYSVLSANRNDYIFYRTDHHWTTKGAYMAYTAAAKKMGFTPVTRDFYDVDHASNDFIGTFYSKILYDGIERDSIDIWLPADGSPEPEIEIYSTFGEEPEVRRGMYFREYLDVKDKYSTFFGTNQPMITVKTGNSGGKLLVFKDSYAHCFVPFLTEHYSEITMVDMRYMMTYKGVVEIADYDQVLFLYNASTFMTDENIKKLMY